MNLSAVAGLPHCPVTGVWYRAVDPQYLSSALSYSHTRLSPSRYYPGPSLVGAFDLVYLAENHQVALFEVEALVGTSSGGVIANPARPWLIVNAQVQLTKVANLTDIIGSQGPLSTTAQELTGSWRHYPGTAPTQELGAALHSDGSLEGFLTISAKLPAQMVLGVFPDRIATGNFVRYTYTDSTGQTQTFKIP